MVLVWIFCVCDSLDTVQIVTFRICVWCLLDVLLKLVFTRLGHERRDLRNQLDRMHVYTEMPRSILSSEGVGSCRSCSHPSIKLLTHQLDWSPIPTDKRDMHCLTQGSRPTNSRAADRLVGLVVKASA